MNNNRSIIRMLKLFAIAVAAFLLVGNAYPQSGYSDTSFLGQIVFANHWITNENFNQENLKTRFDANEQIFGRIYLDKPLADYYREYDWDYDYSSAFDDYNYSIEIFADGKKVIQWLHQLPEIQFNTYRMLELTLVPEPDRKFNYSMPLSDWLDVVKRIGEGEHEIRVEFSPASPANLGVFKEPVSEGSFTLNVSRESRQALTEIYTIGLPEPTLTGEELENEIVDASEDLYNGLVPVKAVIIEPTGQMQYNRDRRGNIINRYFTASVAYKGFQGECAVRTGIYMQKHLGYDNFGEVEFSRPVRGYYNYRLPCKNIGY